MNGLQVIKPSLSPGAFHQPSIILIISPSFIVNALNSHHQRGGVYPPVPAAQSTQRLGPNPPLWVLGQPQPKGPSIRSKSLVGIGPGQPIGPGLSRRTDGPANGHRSHRLPLLPSRKNALPCRNTQLLGASAMPPVGLCRLVRRSLFYLFLKPQPSCVRTVKNAANGLYHCPQTRLTW